MPQPASGSLAPPSEPAQSSFAQRLMPWLFSPLMGGILMVGTGLVLGVRHWLRMPSVAASEIRLGGTFAQRVGSTSKDCRIACAQRAESCFDDCDPDNRSCALLCLGAARGCDDSCLAASAPVRAPFSRYARGDAPEWWISLDRLEKVQPMLQSSCGLESGDSLHIRFTQLDNEPTQVLVDHPQIATAQCATELLSSALHELGRKHFAVTGLITVGKTDYQQLLSDALMSVDQAPSPARRDQAEIAAQAYTARRTRQIQSEPRPPAKPAPSRYAAEPRRSSDAFAEQRSEYQLERERIRLERERHQLERESHLIKNDELGRQRLGNRVAYEQQGNHREFRRDDRSTDRETWQEVEELRRRREQEERRARWERDQKVREMEWRNRAREE